MLNMSYYMYIKCIYNERGTELNLIRLFEPYQPHLTAYRMCNAIKPKLS